MDGAWLDDLSDNEHDSDVEFVCDQYAEQSAHSTTRDFCVPKLKSWVVNEHPFVDCPMQRGVSKFLRIPHPAEMWTLAGLPRAYQDLVSGDAAVV